VHHTIVWRRHPVGERPSAQGRRDALMHRSVVLRRRRGEPRHGGDVGLVEHGRGRRR
jgi:hypothetical protein